MSNEKQKPGLTVQDQLWMANRFGLELADDHSNRREVAGAFINIMRSLLVEPQEINGGLLSIAGLAAEMIKGGVGSTMIEVGNLNEEEQICCLASELTNMFIKDMTLAEMRKGKSEEPKFFTKSTWRHRN